MSALMANYARHASLLGGHALAKQLRGELVQSHAAFLGGGMKVAHQVGVELHGERDEAHLALPIALLPLVQDRGGALAEAVRSGAGAGELAALQLLEVSFLHGNRPVVYGLAVANTAIMTK